MNLEAGDTEVLWPGLREGPSECRNILIHNSSLFLENKYPNSQLLSDKGLGVRRRRNVFTLQKKKVSSQIYYELLKFRDNINPTFMARQII